MPRYVTEPVNRPQPRSVDGVAMMAPSAAPPRRDAINHNRSMTDAQRAEALAELAVRLAELTTPAERRDYPALVHLTDLIDDLTAQ